MIIKQNQDIIDMRIITKIREVKAVRVYPQIV